MDSSKLAAKFFLDDPSALKLSEVVPVFHHWIQSHAIPGHVLIDVADYSHVVDGPGVVLVSHEANLSLDGAEHRPGLLYVRKRPLTGSFRERLRATFAAALGAAARLEHELPGQARFRTDRAMFGISDRLLAPNTPETFAAVKGELHTFLQSLYRDAPVQIEHRRDPARIFEVQITAPAAPSLNTLLDRLA